MRFRVLLEFERGVIVNIQWCRALVNATIGHSDLVHETAQQVCLLR
jgi:hypothetical protein